MTTPHDTPADPPGDSLQRHWRVSNAVWNEVMAALPGLQDSSGRLPAVEKMIVRYVDALVKLWEEHDPAQEMQLRVILRDLPKIVSHELQIPLAEATAKTNLFATRVRRGLIHDLGAWPSTTIETGGLVRTHALRGVETATMDLQMQHAMLKHLMPSTIAGDLFQDKPRLIEVFDQWLKAVAPLMPELDAVTGASQDEVKAKQVAILRPHAYKPEGADTPDPETLEQLHGLYRITAATKAYADALQVGNQPASTTGVADISRYRSKIAERALYEVLRDVGQWDAPRTKTAIDMFNLSLSAPLAGKKVADIAAAESPSR